MRILVTGSSGFVGKNLIAELRSKGYEELYLFDLDTDSKLLDEYTKDCDFVFHLAGVNRPKDQEEFMSGQLRLHRYPACLPEEEQQYLPCAHHLLHPG